MLQVAGLAASGSRDEGISPSTEGQDVTLPCFQA